MGEAGWLFNNLHPHEDHASDIYGVVPLETGTQDSTLLITLHTNLPTLFFFNFILGWLPATCGGALCLCEELFSLVVILPSYPVLSCLPCRVKSITLKLILVPP